MNDICEKLYSNTEQGITARSINLEDMEKWLTGPGKTAKETSLKERISGLSGGTSYIESVDIENNRVTYKKDYSYYPLIWKIEQENSLKESDKHYKSYDELTTKEGQGTSFEKEAGNLTVENTCYRIQVNEDNYGDGASVLELDISNAYWVASRCVDASSLWAYFRLFFAAKNLDAFEMYNGGNRASNQSRRLRAVVSLGSDVQVTPCTNTNSSTNKHTINW